MRYLLDTDSVSFALRGQGEVGARLQAQRPSDLCISAITLAELRYGADRKGSRKLRGLIDTFAAAVDVISFDETCALEFGRIASILAERGTPIGEFDVLIASHAVALRCTLVTNNVRLFSRVPGLLVENWAAVR
jgi:tRNA(fMet)-specific endonuclease VapC